MPPLGRQAIAGLNHRQDLCLIRLGQSFARHATRLCRELADQRINLVLAGMSLDGEGKGATWLCLQEDPLERAWRVARASIMGDSECSAGAEVISPVSLLTIYPRGTGLALCGRVWRAMARAGLDLLALDASLSALALVVRQEDLTKALDALLETLALPAGVEPCAHAARELALARRPRQ